MCRPKINSRPKSRVPATDTQHYPGLAQTGYSSYIRIGKIIQNPFYPAGHYYAVGINPADYIACRRIKAGVAGRGTALFFFFDNFYKRIPAGNNNASIRRIVVYYNNLQRLDGLLSNGLKTLFQVVFFVVNWYNYTKRKFFHRVFSYSSATPVKKAKHHHTNKH